MGVEVGYGGMVCEEGMYCMIYCQVDTHIEHVPHMCTSHTKISQIMNSDQIKGFHFHFSLSLITSICPS